MLRVGSVRRWKVGHLCGCLDGLIAFSWPNIHVVVAVCIVRMSGDRCRRRTKNSWRWRRRRAISSPSPFHRECTTCLPTYDWSLSSATRSHEQCPTTPRFLLCY